MIDAIKTFFSDYLDPTGCREPENSDAQLRLATAALLFEVARADFQRSDREEARIAALLRTQFSLDSEALTHLLALAEQETQRAVSHYPLTQLINRHYTPQQKSRLIHSLWQVAYADGALDKYEDHFIRTIADLIHVPHSEFIRTKLRVAEGG